MRVLVTGGAGFIGQHTRVELAVRGHQAIVFDHLGRGDDRTFLGDVRDPTAVTEAMAHVNGWIHLAGVLGTQETVKNPRPAIETNIIGTLNVLQAAYEYDVPGVYIAVGNHWFRNSYSITKTCAEHLCEMYRKEHHVAVNVVRPVNAYGIGQRASAPFTSDRIRKIIPAFVCRALSGMNIEVYGDGEQISDMVYVADVATTLVTALEQADLGNVVNHALEVGPTEHSSVNRIAELVRYTVEYLTAIRVKIVHLPMRPGEIPNSHVTANPTTLEAIGVDAKDFRPLLDGLRVVVEWFKDNEGKTWQRPQE